MAEEWERPLPHHVTTPLLTRITEGSLDEDYRHAARKHGDRAAPARQGKHLVATGVVAVFGLLVTTAAVQTSRNSDVTDASRATLISRVTAEREMISRDQERIATLQSRNIGAEADLTSLTAELQEAAALQRRLEVRTGYSAVHGEGIRISVDDPPDAGINELVRDEDLAMLVDGLWVAGAEAISVNGQRLTVLSAIRNRGPAVQVNSRPVNPPYVVSAIGDRGRLQADLLDTTHGSRFFDLADQLGFVVDMQNVDDVQLPSARGPRLVHVRRGTGKPGLDRNEEANP